MSQVRTAQAPDEVDLRRTAYSTLVKKGFTPWGKDGWVRDEEGCGTCYDTPWALNEAGFPDLAKELEAAMEREASAARQADPWEDGDYGKVAEVENMGDGKVCMVFANGDRRTFEVADLGFSEECTFSLNEDDEIIVDDVDFDVALDWLSVRSLTDDIGTAARMSGLTESRIAELEAGPQGFGVSELKSLLRAYMADWDDMLEAQDGVQA